MLVIIGLTLLVTTVVGQMHPPHPPPPPYNMYGPPYAPQPMMPMAPPPMPPPYPTSTSVSYSAYPLIPAAAAPYPVYGMAQPPPPSQPMMYPPPYQTFSGSGPMGDPFTSSTGWLVRFSQPAHFITLVTSLYLAFLFFPRESRLAPEQPSTFTSLLYVACFATHFGTQFWMTFASGLVLFFSLPRHIFGKVQKCLFPKYFMVNSLLSAITLALFILHHPSTARGELKVQMWTLLLCFLSELGARLYIVPGLLDALEERMAIEENAGVGMEIGYPNPGPLAYCPHYKQVNKRFRMLHGVCACANVLSMACSTLHLYFLSTRLRSALT